MNIRVFLSALCILVSPLIYGELSADNDIQTNSVSKILTGKRNFIANAGFLMGGGSPIGIDLEYIIPETRLGLQAGVGYASFEGGINYHLEEGPKSPFLSIQYFYQGFEDDHFASGIEPMIVYRAKKWIQVGLGLEILLETPENTDMFGRASTVLTMFNIGVYF